MNQSRLAVILASKSPAHVKKVLGLRELHSCLMEKATNEVLPLQAKATYLNYIAGEGRIKVSDPQYYERNSMVVETYFKFIDKVH